MGWIKYALIGLAALAAGAVNALAGGGTLITFPMLTGMGIPAVAANITNTVALCPGYLGATLAQMKDLRDQRRRLGVFTPAAILGGIAGGILLLHTGERLFREIIPFLILLASLLLAVNDPVQTWMTRRIGVGSNTSAPTLTWAVFPVCLAAVYGGFFGAGLSVIVLAVLGLLIRDSLTRLNALKQVISLSTNTAAATFFLFSGQVIWTVALLMAACALVGGALGGRLARAIKPSTLRWIVVIIGILVAIDYFIRQ